MGGSAFPTQARRLNTTELNALVNHVRTRLLPIYPGGVEVLRHTLDKESHGDVDVLGAAEGWGVGMKGLERGVVGVIEEGKDSNAKGESGKTKVEEKGGDKGTDEGGKGVEKTEQQNKAEMVTAASEALAVALGGTEWVRNGFEISTAVPCDLILGSEHHREVSGLNSCLSSSASSPPLHPLLLSLLVLPLASY